MVIRGGNYIGFWLYGVRKLSLRIGRQAPNILIRIKLSPRGDVLPHYWGLRHRQSLRIPPPSRPLCHSNSRIFQPAGLISVLMRVPSFPVTTVLARKRCYHYHLCDSISSSLVSYSPVSSFTRPSEHLRPS